ncbi:MAG: amidohydrolase family protein [Gemmatimonadota bacterium]
MRSSWLSLVVLLPLASSLAAQQPIAFVHVRILDGNGGPPIEDGVVLTRADRIAAVGAASAVAVPAGARRIEGRGMTLLPGLADLHVHLTGGWDGNVADLLGFHHFLSAFLYAGVTTVFDTGDVLPFVTQLRQETAAGRLAGPRIYLVGPVIDGKTPVWPPISYSVSSADQIPIYVKQLKEAKVDALKAYGGLSTELIRSLAEAGARESLRVFVDAWGKNGSREIAGTGIAAFAHAGTTPMTEETLEYMRSHEVASITTLVVYETFARRRFADLGFLDRGLLAETMPPWYRDALRAHATARQTSTDSARTRSALGRLAGAMQNVKRMFDAGVLLAAGTDAPYPGDYYGEGLHRELELLVEAGLTPLQAITLATKNAALMMRAGSVWGTIEPAKKADLLLVRGDPSVRIGDTRRIVMVMQGGKLLDRAALRFNPAKDPGYRLGTPIQLP